MYGLSLSFLSSPSFSSGLIEAVCFRDIVGVAYRKGQLVLDGLLAIILSHSVKQEFNALRV